MPKRNDSDLKKLDSSHLPSRGVPFSSPHITIYVNNLFPSICFQVPSFISLGVDFPNYSGPPFVRVWTDPSFDRLFNIHIHIYKLAR